MKGFTLIELMIVLVMIGIFSAILIPAYNGYMKAAQDNAKLEAAIKVRPIEKYNKICNDKKCFEVK
jgi:prepilin-type N-terminal cleavage/methylation domain-containing protein